MPSHKEKDWEKSEMIGDYWDNWWLVKPATVVCFHKWEFHLKDRILMELNAKVVQAIARMN